MSIDVFTGGSASSGIPESVVTTKGDLLAASGSAVVTRVPVGSDGNVLTADSTQTAGLKWSAPSALSASAAALRYYDTKDYGAKSDLQGPQVQNITGGSTTIPGSFAGTATDAGKLIRIRAAGTLLASGTDGAMTTGSAATNNRFTSAGSTFTQAVVGRWIVIDGQLTAKVLGVESSTQLRLNAPATTTFSAATWRICEDHYTTISSSTNGGSAVVAVAPITSVTGAYYWWGTDDAPAIQAAVTAAEQAANKGGSGNTVYHQGQSAIGSSIYLQKSTVLLGAGAHGYTTLLHTGNTQLMILAPRIRGIVAGGTDTGMGVQGAMTSGSAVLTDPQANFQSGDVGKHILVYGAGTQTGSTLGENLNTTIASWQSSTQVTLSATAGTTVSGAIYSYATSTGYTGGLVGPSVKDIHVVGAPDSLAGLHLMNSSNSVIGETACSDFSGGVAIFNDGGPSTGFTNQTEFRSVYACDSRIGIKSGQGTLILTGNCYVDGNSNRVDCGMVEGMTIGVDTDSLQNWGYCAVQAVGTCVRASGKGGSAGCQGFGWTFENFQVMFDLASDGSTGGYHHSVGFTSAGNSNAGGGYGIRLRAGARAKLLRGYTLDGDINMYGLVDPTATLTVMNERVIKSGSVSNSDFVNTPFDGAQGIDTSTGDFYFLANGIWRKIQSLAIPSRIKRHNEVAQTGAVTSMTLTVTSTVPVGHTMVVPFVHGGSTQTMTVSDSKGNTYVVDDVADLATGQAPHAGIARGRVTTQLVNGDTVTVTAGGSVNVLSGELYEYAGIAASPLDQASTPATGSASTSVNPGNITTTNAADLMLTVVCNGGSTSVATATPDDGSWTNVSTFAFASGLKRYTFLERIVFATGTYTDTLTLSASNDWAAVLVAYKSGS